MSDEKDNNEEIGPLWLQKLEQEREKRIKSRLSHEIGAGAKCIECKDSCPGLDLHFWRKICKNCKCSKESHDVQNTDDIYNWVQFQLLGNKDKRRSKKIVLRKYYAPVELDWIPKGSQNNVSQYLNEMSPDLLPVTGSKAARIRQKHLQKQIPAYDIDSSLCHDLSKDELQEFDKYLQHLKSISVGQGNLVKLQLADNMAKLDKKLNQLVFESNKTTSPTEIEQIPTKFSLKDIHAVLNDDNDFNVNKLPKCAHCSLQIIDNSIVIQIERSDKLWHPNCFKCNACEQLLVDLMYFFNKKDNRIYCGRDYAQIKGIPRCLACDELIFSNEYCSAENNVFHVKHFCCFICDKPLAGFKYIMDDNQPICLECYNRVKANICQTCKSLINPDQQGVTIKEFHWHLSEMCFRCSTCKTSVIDSKVLVRNDKLFCSKICFK